ncbi:MAG: methyltransferase domain-containing protein [Candidatus Moranbacteria bacterium]|nr:methyltransferase domain-containing protein [Candidatus Moranbacteria bacterium]
MKSLDPELSKYFARFYDSLELKKKYKQELDFIRAIVDRYNPQNKRTLVLNCGSGLLLAKLKKIGFEVSGLEKNKELIKIAKQRDPNLEIFNNDLADYKTDKRFDLILYLSKNINLNSDEQILSQNLAKIYTWLNNKGLLIFDLGLLNKEELKSNVNLVDYYKDKEQNIQMARISQWDKKSKAKNKIKSNYLVLTKMGEEINFFVEENEMTIFEIDKVEAIMEQLGYKVRIYNGFDSNDLSSNSKNPVFVGQVFY